MTHLPRTLAAALVASLAACSGGLRNVEAYRADTAKLLATRGAQLQRCYDDALRTDGKAAGTVTVQFAIEKDTGAISRPTVDPAHSTAPPALGRCVVKAIDGLVLAPPDSKEGRATFVYEFQPAAAT
ncbi:MAG TPA: hypothetical protein VHT91_40120 [Kofleriaceae bacterium]|jgi:hypothetical protein|nr:hypothetical protein [Kofleriaceae bacterium]